MDDIVQRLHYTNLPRPKNNEFFHNICEMINSVNNYYQNKFHPGRLLCQDESLIDGLNNYFPFWMYVPQKIYPFEICPQFFFEIWYQSWQMILQLNLIAFIHVKVAKVNTIFAQTEVSQSFCDLIGEDMSATTVLLSANKWWWSILSKQ